MPEVLKNSVTPTVGRVVYVFSPHWNGPRRADVLAITGEDSGGGAQIIAEVSLNPFGDPGARELSGFAPDRFSATGDHRLAVRDLPIFDPGQDVKGYLVWAEWMPYQMPKAAPATT